jgi:hypothetical protein
MPFATVCPSCDARLTAPDAVRGKKVKCKKCGDPFVARPAAEPDDDDEARPAKSPARSRRADEDSPPRKPSKARVPADDEDDKPRPKKKGKGKKKGSPVLVFVLLGVVALLLIGRVVGAYFAFFKEEKPKDNTVANADGPKGGPSRGEPGGPGAAAGEWVEHVDAEGKYRIKFPAKPTTKDETENVGGTQQTRRVAHALAGAEGFFASAAPIPPDQDQDPERVMDMAEREAGTQLSGATVTSKQAVTHAGVAGRELVLTAQGPGGAATAVLRLFVVNGRCYMAAVMGPAVQANSPNVVKFFESLRFE